jgi:hypothetical protein
MDIDKLTLSFSSLKQFGKSPAHFVGYKNRIFKQSAPMRRGWLTHLITLEPEKIQELQVLDVATRANKQYKEAVANHKDGENGVFTAREMLEAQNLALAVREHPLANKLLSEAICVEKHLKWEMDGVKFHGYADIIGSDYIADLKITDNEPKKIQRWVMDNLYHMQLAMYSEAVFPGRDMTNYLITVDPNSPRGVVVYELSREMMEDGLKQAQLEITMFKIWYKDWDGESTPRSYDFYERENEPMILELPNWYK